MWNQIAGGAISTAGVAGVMAGALLHKEDDVEWMGPEIAGLARTVLERRGGQYLDIERDLGLGLGEIGLQAGRQQLFGTTGTPGIIDTIFGASNRLGALSSEEAMRTTGQRIAQFRQADPILGTLSSQIERDLGLEGRLDPETRREVQQAVRSGQSARGMGFGNADLFAEMMEIGSMSEARKRERQAAAMNLLAHPANPTATAMQQSILTPFQQFSLAQQIASPQLGGPLGTGFGATGGAGANYFGGAPVKPDPADNRWSNVLMLGGSGAMQVGGMVYGGGGGMDASSMMGSFGGG